MGVKRGDKKKASPKKADASKKQKKKKRSSSGGAGMANAKNWLMLNVEKLVLGLIGVGALVLIYTGLKGTGLSATEGPDQLNSKLVDASGRLQPEGRDQVLSLRYPEPDTFDQQATKDINAVDAVKYAMDQPFFPLLQKQQKLRQDPAIVLPTDIIVRSGYGPLMLRAEESTLNSFSSNNSENVRSIPSELSERWNSSTGGGGLAKPVSFNSIVGIIPVREQVSLYNEAFIGAAEYDLGRDFPRYVGLNIERRESGTAEWTALNVMETILLEPAKWTGMLDSKVAQKYAPDYIKPVVMDIPPIGGTMMDDFVSHPMLQTESEAEAESKAIELAKAAADKEAQARGTGHGSYSANDSLTEEEQAYAKLASAADIGMFRYFDFDVQPGKDYEYRVRLVLEDPNNPDPETGGTKPSHGSLDPKVLVRLTDVAESNGRFSVRESEWTEPTAPIRVPHPGRAIIGSAIAGSTIGRSEIPASSDGEPRAKLVAVGFDQTNGYVVPVELEVTRGTLLNTKQDTEVIDPSKNQIVKLNDYSSKTGILVVDIAGGKTLTSGRRDAVISHGKVLLFSQDGSFIVSDELADVREYASSAIPEDEEAIRERERVKLENQRNNERDGRGRGERGRGERGRGESGRGEEGRGEEGRGEEGRGAGAR